MHECIIAMSHTAIGPCTGVCARRAWHGNMMGSGALLGQCLGSLKAPFSHAAPSRSSRCRLRPVRPLAAFKGFGKAVEKKPSETKQCPCGSGQAYDDCCKVYHEGTLPETAEALMRSRYSAYAKGIVDYVVKTTHPDNPLKPGTSGSTLVDDVRATCDKIGWERLKVLEVEDGATPDEAFVTFQTWFKVRKQIGKRQKGWHTQTFVERSRFLRDETRGWLYVDGDQEWEPDNKESSVPVVKK